MFIIFKIIAILLLLIGAIQWFCHGIIFLLNKEVWKRERENINISSIEAAIEIVGAIVIWQLCEIWKLLVNN